MLICYCYVFLNLVYGPLGESFSPEWKRKQLEYYVALRIDGIEGVSSKWDYEKNRWKE